MSNEDQQNQSTELESENNFEEPPSFEETLDALDKVFDDDSEGIDAAGLLREAEIKFSEFLQCVQCQMEKYSRTIACNSIGLIPLERLNERDLDFLSDEDVLCYLQAEGINCELFLGDICDRIETNTRVAF
mgnify:CR=1 FL=1